MKSYSTDIRARVIAAHLNGEGSQRAIAVRFRVSLGFVQDVIRHFRRTGQIGSNSRGGGPPPKLDEEGLLILSRILEAHPTATLDALCEQFSIEAGLKLSRATMWRYAKRVRTGLPRASRGVLGSGVVTTGGDDETASGVATAAIKTV